MEALCTALTQKAELQRSAQSTNVQPGRPIVLFTALANNKISIIIEKDHGGKSSRYTIFVLENAEYSSTMPHRMGFSRTHVANEHFTMEWNGVSPSAGSAYNEALVNASKNRGTRAKQKSETEYNKETDTVVIWTSYATNIVDSIFQKTHTSLFIGF
jgi:hypothetical protein